jgi:hypothetical protein
MLFVEVFCTVNLLLLPVDANANSAVGVIIIVIMMVVMVVVVDKRWGRLWADAKC